MNDLYLLAINLTKRCNLACAHCYLDADTLKNGTGSELSTEEVCRLLNQVAKRSQETMVVLTGGEPLLRKDLEVMVKHGSELGLSMVVGTNGTLLTEKRVQALQEAGLMGAGISVDSLDSAQHDQFRGKPGSWQLTQDGIENCRRHQLSFQIHFSVSQSNLHELNDIVAFSHKKGARVLNVFFLICTGRGESMTDISPQEYEAVIQALIEQQEKYPEIIIRPRCAPHYKRVAYQHDPSASVNRISGNEGDGCIAGKHYCRITPEGAVTACPFIPDELGNVREQAFLSIWDQAPQLMQLRQPKLEGKCASCEFQRLCGGCRARPYAQGSSLMAADPWCVYQPKGGDIIESLEIAEQTVQWSKEAETRLNRIPGFIRRMVRKRTEGYVGDLAETIILPRHMDDLIKKRFGDNAGKLRATKAPVSPAGKIGALFNQINSKKRQVKDDA